MLGAVRALRVSCRISYDGGLSKAFTFTEGTYGAQGGLQLLQGCMTLVAATEAGVSQGGLCEEQTGPAAGSDQHKHCYADVEAYRNRVLLHRTPRCWHLPSSPSISWPASTPLLAVQYSYSKQLQVTASSMYSTVADAPGVDNCNIPASKDGRGGNQPQACEPSGAVSRAFEKLLWGSQSVQQLQQNIQQAAPSMGPPHAALAFAAAAELLDRSSSSSGAHRDNMSQQLIGTLANIWQRQLDKASPADMLVALCAWSRLGIAQEQQAWASTVDAFTRNCQGASQRDIGRVATAIAAAAADAGNSAAVTTAVDALAAMFERFAAQDTVHVPALAKLITAYEILGVSLPALLQALVQQHEQSLVAYEQKQLLYQITGSCSLQQLEDILKQFGSTLGAANVAAAATKVAKMVAAEPSQRAAGRRLLSQGVANVWSQKLAAAASGDIARVLVACTEIGCYGNPVLSGGSLSALLLQLQKLDSKQAAQCEGQSVDALIQKQQQQNQHQQQQGRQTTRLGIRALNSVLFFIGQCGKHHGSIPGLSAGDVAQLLDALSQQVALHLQYDAVNKHWKGLGSVGVSMLMMARAAVQAPSSSGELTTLLNSLVVVVQLQPIEGKHVARIMHALGRLQHDCPWQPRLDGVLWQQLLSPAQVEQIASTSPKHVANTVGALALLATNVPVWGVNVDYAASISKQLACTVVRQLLVGRVARELGGWNTLDVRTVLSACLTLDVRVEPFLQQLHATALIKKWGKNIESLLQQLAATDELALTEKTMIKSCQQQAQLFT